MRDKLLRLIKKNPALATGIILPVLLVVLFAFAALLPRLFIDSPKYDLLFSMRSYSLQSEYEYKFSVSDDGHLEWFVRKSPPSNGAGGYDYRLYRFDAATGEVHAVELPSPGNTGRSWTKRQLKIAEDWHLNASLGAPDGYHLYSDYKRTSDLGLVFFSGSQRSAVHVANGSRIYSIYPPHSSRGFNTPEFIGWIVPEETAQGSAEEEAAHKGAS